MALFVSHFLLELRIFLFNHLFVDLIDLLELVLVLLVPHRTLSFKLELIRQPRKHQRLKARGVADRPKQIKIWHLAVEQILICLLQDTVYVVKHSVVRLTVRLSA